MRSKVGAPHEFAKREKTSESIPTILALFYFPAVAASRSLLLILQSGDVRLRRKNDLRKELAIAMRAKIGSAHTQSRTNYPQPTGAQTKHPEAAKLVKTHNGTASPAAFSQRTFDVQETSLTLSLALSWCGENKGNVRARGNRA